MILTVFEKQTEPESGEAVYRCQFEDGGWSNVFAMRTREGQWVISGIGKGLPGINGVALEQTEAALLEEAYQQGAGQ